MESVTVSFVRNVPNCFKLLVALAFMGSAATAFSGAPDSETSGPALLQTIETLGSTGGAEAVAKLETFFTHPDLGVAEAAVAALARIADEPAQKSLGRLRSAHEARLIRAVVDASFTLAEKLTDSGEVKAATAIYEELTDAHFQDNVRRGSLEALFRIDPDGGEQRIERILAGHDALLAPVAINGIRNLPSAETSRRFAARLPKLPPQEQVWLIDVLSTRTDAPARAAVENSLTSSELDVRLAAIEGLGRNGDTAAVQPLFAALERVKPGRERNLIEKALAALAGDAATDRAIEAKLQFAPAQSKPVVFAVLAKRGARSAIPMILNESTNETCAAAAFQALESLAESEDLPKLLDALGRLQVESARSDAEAAVARALSMVPSAATRWQTISGRLNDADRIETRCSLLRLLPACAGTNALAALALASRQPVPEIREAAIRALVEWPDLAAWDLLADLYAHSTTPVFRSLALDALARLLADENERPSAALFARYESLLLTIQKDVDLKVVLGALSGARHSEAVRLIKPLLRNPGVKAEAEAALRSVNESLMKTARDPGPKPAESH